MTVVWDGYEPYVPPIVGLRHELSRAQAREAYEHLMASKQDRILQLSTLLRANGFELSSSDTAIQQLNDWFRLNVERAEDGSGRLRNIWYAVVNDISLFLGDELISRNPGVRWTLFLSGAKNASYQRHVLAGFADVPNPKYNVDIDRLIAAYGHRVVSGASVDAEYFLSIIRPTASN